MGRKFCRGVTNVFTGWIEIPAQISKGYKRQCLYGATVGILTGVWYAAGRTLAGFYDMAGFWAADPCSNEGVGIPLDAEYAWEEGCHYDLIHPKYGKATIEPFGKKLGRGVGNAAFGLLDVPGQMMKAMKCNAFDLGIGKALWYFASREFDGLYEIASSPFPNPCDTAGVKFDEEWPWQAVKADRWW
jgi:putative exosortase-associated protein (TIGR04073 family)